MVAPDNSQSDQSNTQSRAPPAFCKTITTIKKITLAVYRKVNAGNTCCCHSMHGASWTLPHNLLGLFSLYFDDCLVSTILEQTNFYAEQCLTGTNKQWSTNAKKIRANFGFMILMGINNPGTTGLQNKYLRYAPIADRISRDSFEEITHTL